MQTENIPIWGKLIPLAKGLEAYAIKERVFMIGRTHGKVKINEKRLSGKHCSLEKEGDSVFLTDLSTNGTYLNSEKVGKGNKVEIKEGD